MNQVIPEAAVEAAAKALYPEVREEWRVPPDPWESIPEDDDAKIEAIALARLALEAAAPHMLQAAKAEAWDEGREADDFEVSIGMDGNPYRPAP